MVIDIWIRNHLKINKLQWMMFDYEQRRQDNSCLSFCVNQNIVLSFSIQLTKNIYNIIFMISVESTF